jgi:cell division protease FtsH
MNRNFNRQDERNKEEIPNRPSPLGRWSWLLWVLLLIILVPWLSGLLFGGDQGSQITYTEFRQQVEQGNVSQVTVTGEKITGELKQPATKPAPQGFNNSGTPIQYTNFFTYLPSFGDDQLFPLLRENNVVVQTEPANQFSWGLILINALPFLLLLGIGFWFISRMRNQGEGLFQVGKSKAKRYEKTNQRVTFEDVAGAHGAKRELEEIIEFLREPAKFERLGGEIPKGVLLVGSPGTGKTLLARAVAGEADVPFFSITGSDFMEMFVGVGASRVRDLFNDAKQNAPSIIFIDELDSIGRRRGAGIGGGHDEREQTLNQMLSEMDGFEPNENVIVMAATNRPDILDPALLRPGRFDRRITVDLPTLKDRVEILKIHSRNKPLAGDVDLETIARGTPGFSGADLENILNEAALLAARKGKQVIEDVDIEGARDKVMLGLERDSLTLTNEEVRMLAYHEAGHAVVAAVLPHADPVHKVTIVPRGMAMGVTQQLPERERYIYPMEYMLDRLAVMMGGRAAENLIFNTMTSGAENDLKEATKLARKMVLDWGMSKRLGHIAFGDGNEQVFLGEDLGRPREFSETTAREVDEEVKSILDEAYVQARKTLEKNKEGMDRIVDELLDKEEIPGTVVLELLDADKVIEEDVSDDVPSKGVKVA